MTTKKTFENLPEEKQRRVLDEATVEFAEHGYHQASINRIVDRLGIAKGSLFKYFGTKQGLFEHIFGHAVAGFKKPLKAIRATPDLDFFERIEQSFLAGAKFVDEHPNLYRIYLKMLFNENFPLRERFLGEIRGANAKYLRQLIENGIKAGELPVSLDVDMAVFTLHAVMDRFLQGYAVPSLDNGLAPAANLQARARALAAFLRHGLADTPSQE
ncbi:TetR/AcrR family transcriptional regulator [Pseudodesulfovibrio thermohalotolerans]|uniref:TetR/AcrR family transcriptional regulator n=1 Tax=Pseudodesulfovibrio thermohalotolerans TaxID=2880651 RepID=UPI00244296AB|nr:TetR/AcrR family transcriptional regulator [Pseudodesulfovibrio thermohalotolerans]WFS63704.1 TetR/AcrR family transcriptional regulator [Pseudodesulfovibrio thermohalotolerans]